MSDNESRRIVITGVGVVAPNGIGKEAYWHALQHGLSGITPLQHELNTQNWVAGVVSDFQVENYIERKLVQRSDRMTHLAFAALQEALLDARLEAHEPTRTGIVIANTMGGVDYVLRQLQTLYTRGPRFVSAYTAIAWLNVANVGQAAIRYNLQGYCKTPVNDTVGGLDALGMAYTAIQRGAADVIISGGCEALLHPMVMQVLAYHGHCLLSDDVHAYRPFDERAAGLLLAEGAGMCVLEEYEHARRRGAPMYGEIVGYAQTNDAHGLRLPSSNGKHYARALKLAMQEGQIEPETIAYISLDGRADPASDEGECSALQLVFQEQLPHIPVSVPRTMIGHSYAAAGAIDTITALLALQHGQIPPTINSQNMMPELDLVCNEPRPLVESEQKQSVLIGGRGVGGVNVALAVKKVERDASNV